MFFIYTPTGSNKVLHLYKEWRYFIIYSLQENMKVPSLHNKYLSGKQNEKT